MTSMPPPILSVRAGLVLLIAVVIGMVAGVLSYLAQHNLPSAVLVGGGAAGASLLLFNTLLGADPREPGEKERQQSAPELDHLR